MKDGAAMNLVVRRDSLTSLTSHNKQTFQRFIGSFRSAVGSRDDGTDTLSCESAGLFLAVLISVIIVIVMVVVITLGLSTCCSLLLL